MRKKGKFIVIEGIDGAGGETQSKLLKKFLEEKGKKVLLLRYPDRKGYIGKVIIYQFLEKSLDISPKTLFLLYFTDFMKDSELIRKSLKKGIYVIADRYFTSTLAHQSVQGININTMLKIADLMNLPKPDLAIFLKISPETSLQRKYKEKKKLDRFERDKKFLTKVAKKYEELARKNIFCEWKIIDGEKSKQEVFKEIKEIISKFLLYEKDLL